MEYVYKIRNILNNKIYIGVSNNPKRRWDEHCRNNNKYYSMIDNAIQKYGKENFEFEILEDWDLREKALQREKELISDFRCLAPYGYNIHEGGGAPPVQNKISQELANKIIDQLLDLKISRKTIIANNKITNAILENINLGKAWRRDELSYPLRPNEHLIIKERAKKIQSLLKNSTLSQEEIAKQFGISKTEVSNINKGKTYFDRNEIYPLRNPIAGQRGRTGKKVQQIKVQSGEIIAVFDSVSSASQNCGINKTSIAKCCRGEQKTAGGFFWKYVN